MKTWRAFLLLLLLLPITAAAQNLLSQYSQAMRDARSGDAVKARQAFDKLRDLAENHPDDKLADDALYQAGEVAERYLGEYNLAQQMYEQVIERFPDSRNAMRAKGALRRLARGRETGDRPYFLYTQVLRQYAQIGSEEALKRMKDLYRQYPDFRLADRVGYWIAEEYTRLDSNEEALPYYRDVIKRFPDERYGFLAQVGLGNAFIELRQFRQAADAFQALATMKGYNEAKKISDYYVGITYQFMALWVLFWLTLAVVAGWVIRVAAFTPWRNLQPRILLRIWPELLALLVPMSGGVAYVWDRSLDMRESLLWLMVGATLMLLGNTAHIYARQPGTIHAQRFSAFSALVGLALTYAIFYLTDLLNVLLDSLKATFNI